MLARLARAARRQPIALAALFVALGGSSYAATSAPHSSPSHNVIQACVGKSTGRLRVVDSPARCGSLETAIAFNREGRRGPKGMPGRHGQAGTNSTNGINGINGAKGEQGLAGANGAKGLTGANGGGGDRGDTGAAGANGSNGLDGAKGDTGDTGDTGTPGATGDQGDPGPAGPQGPTGATGPAGPTHSATISTSGPLTGAGYNSVGSTSITTTAAGRLTVNGQFDINGSTSYIVHCRVFLDGVDPGVDSTIVPMSSVPAANTVAVADGFDVAAGTHSVDVRCTGSAGVGIVAGKINVIATG